MQAQSSNHTTTDDAGQQVRALYVHIPFCRSKCSYCDFYSLSDRQGLAETCLRAISLELQRQDHHLTAPLDSIFVGGGTPTALQLPMLEQLLMMLAEYRDDRTEFSIEANPCTVTSQLARSLHQAGVNRVNIGAQSFIDAELDALGRIHDQGQIVRAWETLRLEGHKRLGLDLIYAAPEQNPDSWRFSLKKALNLAPDHLSCYALTIESDTELGRQRDSGRFVEMDESDQVECYLAAVDYAQAAGLEQYEISNFATPKNRCRHNLTYWLNKPYLGIGPAAASYIGGIRRTNCPDVEAYIQAINAGTPPPSQWEKLTARAEMGETVMLALRMIEGVDREAFIARFGMDLTEAFARTIKRYCSQGALQLTPQRLRIAPDAMMVSNTIMADILAEV